MNKLSLGNLAVTTISNPAQAARELILLKPGREALWLAFFLAVVLGSLLQLGIDVSESSTGTVENNEPIPLVLLKYAGTLLLSIVAFTFIGRLLGGTGTFESIMVLTIWLQFLQIAAMLLMLVLTPTFPFLMIMVLVATAILSLYITLHFLNEAHQFGSLLKSFGVILLSALAALPFILMLTPSAPV
ncbi:MAG: YIP1 family protein [Pseudomonadota bacterium]